MGSTDSSFNNKDFNQQNKVDIEKDFPQETIHTLHPSLIGLGWDIGSDEEDGPCRG